MEKENRRRRGREKERREGLRHEREAEGRGKFAGVTDREEVGGGRRQAIWVRGEEEDWRRDRRDEQARAQQQNRRLGVEGKQGASGRGKEKSEWETERDTQREGRKKRKQARESDRDRGQRRRRRWGGDWQGRRSERGQREGDFESVRQTRETELVR